MDLNSNLAPGVELYMLPGFEDGVCFVCGHDHDEHEMFQGEYAGDIYTYGKCPVEIPVSE